MRSRDSYVPILEAQPQILQTFTLFGANSVKPQTLWWRRKSKYITCKKEKHDDE